MSSKVYDIEAEIQDLAERYEELLSKREALLNLEKRYLQGHHQVADQKEKSYLAIQERNQTLLNDIEKLEKQVSMNKVTSQDGRLIAVRKRYMDYMELEFNGRSNSPQSKDVEEP